MTHCHSDRMLDGIVHVDDFGTELPLEQMPDQAKEVVWSLLEEWDKPSVVVIVTVCAESGLPIYVAHGVVGGIFTAGPPPDFPRE